MNSSTFYDDEVVADSEEEGNSFGMQMNLDGLWNSRSSFRHSNFTRSAANIARYNKQHRTVWYIRDKLIYRQGFSSFHVYITYLSIVVS